MPFVGVCTEVCWKVQVSAWYSQMLGSRRTCVVRAVLQFCFYLLHWAACGFWYVALQQGGGDNKRTWVAQEEQMLSGSSTVELYIFSFYWALVTFATLG